jgi:hypothetical protein
VPSAGQSGVTPRGLRIDAGGIVTTDISTQRRAEGARSGSARAADILATPDGPVIEGVV